MATAPKLHLISFGYSSEEWESKVNKTQAAQAVATLKVRLSEAAQIDYGVYLFRAVEDLSLIRALERALEDRGVSYVSAVLEAGAQFGSLDDTEAAKLRAWGVNIPS